MFSRRWSCAWAGVVNLENRLVPGGIDSRVLAELRRAQFGAIRLFRPEGGVIVGVRRR